MIGCAIFTPLMRVDAWPKSLIVTVLAALVLAPWLPLSAASSARARPSRAAPARLATLASFPVFSDFDGDQRLDRAELFSSGLHKSIHVSLGNSWESQLYFDSDTCAHGSLLAGDIDHDSDLDLIWISETTPLLAVVWLGDGQGHFKVANETQAYTPALSSLLGNGAETGVADGQASPGSLACVLSSSVSSDLPATHKLEWEDASSLKALGVERRRGLALCLAFLRERGPPSNLS